MSSFPQEKHCLSRKLPVVSFLHLVPLLIDAKYKPLNYADARTILPPEQSIPGSQPGKGQQKEFPALSNRGGHSKTRLAAVRSKAL